MTEYSYEIKIPKERVAVLIGKKGEIKQKLEKATKTKIQVDSNEGDVILTGEDALGLYTGMELVTAVGRGFNPEVAQLLLKGDYVFEQINLGDLTKNKNHFIRLKGRLIGSEGKCRKLMEELTETYICVYGKTIGIIGESENVVIAKRAVQSIISGSPHSSVYRWLEQKRRDIKKRAMGINE
ncbi:MAG: RNA-processing protein [bacterium]|nr:RNA-processing protein [bacterium]